MKTLTLSVPDEEELQTEFEVEDQGRTFRCILYFVKSGVSTECPKKLTDRMLLELRCTG